MTKILALVGSPRKGGNTDILTDRVMEGATRKSDRVITEKVYISGLDLKFCQGDLVCRKTGECIIRDDMVELLNKIIRADGLIVGAPLYRGVIAGQMKVFMDRTTPLEKAIDEEKMKIGAGLKVTMGLLARLIPVKLQLKMMQSMAGGTGHLYRLEKKNSVVLVVGAHPSYLPQMKRDLEQAAHELGSFSLMSGGKIVATILATGVSDRGDVLDRPELLDQAFKAGEQLVLSCAEMRR